MLAYAIEISPDDNGTLLVTCPDLPEVTTWAEDEADAVLRARDAIEEALAARIADREEIPVPAPALGRPVAALPALAELKIALYCAMRETGTRKADLARLLSAHGPQVDRLLDLRHASRLDQLETALAALNKRVEVRVM
jgi:antitoxin HicB